MKKYLLALMVIASLAISCGANATKPEDLQHKEVVIQKNGTENREVQVAAANTPVKFATSGRIKKVTSVKLYDPKTDKYNDYAAYDVTQTEDVGQGVNGQPSDFKTYYINQAFLKITDTAFTSGTFLVSYEYETLHYDADTMGKYPQTFVGVLQGGMQGSYTVNVTPYAGSIIIGNQTKGYYKNEEGIIVPLQNPVVINYDGKDYIATVDGNKEGNLENMELYLDLSLRQEMASIVSYNPNFIHENNTVVTATGTGANNTQIKIPAAEYKGKKIYISIEQGTYSSDNKFLSNGKFGIPIEATSAINQSTGELSVPISMVGMPYADAQGQQGYILPSGIRFRVWAY